MAPKTPGSGQRFLRMFGPVFRALRALGGSARPREVYDLVAQELKLTAEERAERTEKGSSIRYEQDISWARYYLVRVGILSSSQHGVWGLTEKGAKLHDISLDQAKEILKQVRAELAASKAASSSGIPSDTAAAPDDDSPDPVPSGHRHEVIDILQTITPTAFERFCQRLLRESGFQNVEVTGRSHDGGIDGTGMLRVNVLVSFKVIFQCKRYRDAVSNSEVRNLQGAMTGRADKGIILTTGRFTEAARKEAVRDGAPPIELVDGDKLVDMLEELGIGLLPVRTFQVDRPFFESFQNLIGDQQPQNTRPVRTRRTARSKPHGP